LLGLAEAGHPADPATDAMVRYLVSQQMPDGHWSSVAHRPPSGSGEIQVAAAAIRTLELYAPAPQRAAYHQAARRAAAWLLHARPASTDERAFLLLGLTWAGLRDSGAARMAIRALLSEQRADGGWAQIASLESDAFATGQAMFALYRAGGLVASDPAYRRGVHFLLKTQLSDGSWYVRTRSIPLQPYFESGFPHGPDQWISAAATNWATLALVSAAGQGRVARK
jgi:squalene cyclase